MSDRSQSPAFRAAELAAILARHYPDASPYRIASVVAEMQRATRAAKAFAEARCNYDLGDPDDSKSDYARRYKRQENAAARINAMLAWTDISPSRHDETIDRKHGLAAKIVLGGDPRGACGRLIIPGQRGDGWGDGFAIY